MREAREETFVESLLNNTVGTAPESAHESGDSRFGIVVPLDAGSDKEYMCGYCGRTSHSLQSIEEHLIMHESGHESKNVADMNKSDLVMHESNAQQT